MATVITTHTVQTAILKNDCQPTLAFYIDRKVFPPSKERKLKALFLLWKNYKCKALYN
jgi:hypothetical protein